MRTLCAPDGDEILATDPRAVTSASARSQDAVSGESIARDLDAYREQVQRYLRAIADQFRIPGLVLEILGNGYRVSVAAGDIIADTVRMPVAARFQLGRSGRFLASLVVLDQVARGRIDLAASVAEYLPELRDTRFGQQVSVLHVLCDSCGYRPQRTSDIEALRDYSWDRLVLSLKSARQLFREGTVVGRTLESPALIAQIVERTAGRPLPSLVAELLEELNIDSGRALGSSADNVAVSHVPGMGSGKLRPIAPLVLSEFWSSALMTAKLCPADFMNVVDAVLVARQGSGTPARISQQLALAVQRQSVQIPFAPHGGMPDELPMSFGVGCQQFRPDWFGLNGPPLGQSFCFRYHRTQRFAVVLGLNVSAPSACNRIVSDIIRSIAGQPEEIPVKTTPGCAMEPEDLAGSYVGTSGADLEISVDAGEVVCELADEGRSRVRMMRDSHRRWVARSPAAETVGLFRDESGETCLMLGGVAYKRIRRQ